MDWAACLIPASAADLGILLISILEQKVIPIKGTCFAFSEITGNCLGVGQVGIHWE